MAQKLDFLPGQHLTQPLLRLNQRPEVLDLAFAAGAGVNHVAILAYPAILGRFDIEAGVEIDRWTAFLKLGAHPYAAPQQEVDAVGAGDQRAREHGPLHTVWALFLLPPDALGAGGSGADGSHADDGALFYLHLRHDYGGGAASGSRNQGQEEETHSWYTIMRSRMISPA